MLSSDTAAKSRPAPLVHKRADVLRESFPAVASAIDGQRTLALDSGLVADFVALGWLRWEHGALTLTAAGLQVRTGRHASH